MLIGRGRRSNDIAAVGGLGRVAGGLLTSTVSRLTLLH